jgi:hypothetical protein
MFSNVDDGHSRISSSGTSKGARRRCFLALVVDTPGSPAPALSEGPSSMFLSVDGGRSWISSPGTSRGPLSTFLSVDGGRS